MSGNAEGKHLFDQQLWCHLTQELGQQTNNSRNRLKTLKISSDNDGGKPIRQSV
jgi:hypothetical protein